jgi:hypothetical protein
MMEPHQQPPHRRLWHWMQRNEDTAFAIVMASMAALFIIGIVTAFNYSAPINIASGPAATPPAVTALRLPAETTGTSGGDRPRPPFHDPREDEQMERRQ